jgi:putative nucleotidyltransferase with HDIG domain
MGHGGVADKSCARCGRVAADERLIERRCVRCRTLMLVDALDDHMALHTRRVTMFALQVAERLRLDHRAHREVELGGLLHDIGKLAMPGRILAKAGPLDDAEEAVMRTHTIEGERIAGRLTALPPAVPQVVRSSHERWDGEGYPDGLRGDEIPLAARIVAAADALDAMTSSRSYRAALPIDLALEVLRMEAGRQFDPTVIAVLADVVEEWRAELDAEAVSSAFEETLRRLKRGAAA